MVCNLTSLYNKAKMIFLELHVTLVLMIVFYNCWNVIFWYFSASGIVSAPLGFCHKDTVVFVVCLLLFFKDKETRFSVGSSFSRCFKELIRHPYNRSNIARS